MIHHSEPSGADRHQAAASVRSHDDGVERAVAGDGAVLDGPAGVFEGLGALLA